MTTTPPQTETVTVPLGERAYPILIGHDDSPDESLQFGNSRGVLPYTVLIGADGRILKRHAGAFERSELDAWVR